MACTGAYTQTQAISSISPPLKQPPTATISTDLRRNAVHRSVREERDGGEKPPHPQKLPDNRAERDKQPLTCHAEHVTKQTAQASSAAVEAAQPNRDQTK
jgi:hypothetical protein